MVKKWNGNIYFQFKPHLPIKKFEIKNGNGKFMEKNYDDKNIFEGEYLNGEIKGKVKMN